MNSDKRAGPHTTVNRLVGDKYRFVLLLDAGMCCHQFATEGKQGEGGREDMWRLISPSAPCRLIFLSVTALISSLIVLFSDDSCLLCICSFLFLYFIYLIGH